MNATILRVIGPGSLNQVPTLGVGAVGLDWLAEHLWIFSIRLEDNVIAPPHRLAGVML